MECAIVCIFYTRFAHVEHVFQREENDETALLIVPDNGRAVSKILM